MTYSENLWLFFLLVSGIIIVPGMDMVFVLASALSGGRRAGLSATFGIMAGGLVHTLYAALGVGMLLHFAPKLFNGLLVLGLRWELLHHFGYEVPYWVEWKRGAMLLFKPWAEHRLTWAAIFALDNEHRIALPRSMRRCCFGSRGATSRTWAAGGCCSPDRSPHGAR